MVDAASLGAFGGRANPDITLVDRPGPLAGVRIAAAGEGGHVLMIPTM